MLFLRAKNDMLFQIQKRVSEEKKKELLGSACGEGRKVQVSVAAIKLPRVADAQVHEINMKFLHYFI